MEQFYKKLVKLDKDEIIERFLTIELKPFLDFYKNGDIPLKLQKELPGMKENLTGNRNFKEHILGKKFSKKSNFSGFGGGQPKSQGGSGKKEKLRRQEKLFSYMVLQRLFKKIIKTVGKTNFEYGLIEKNDRIMIAVSGGKDSL